MALQGGLLCALFLLFGRRNSENLIRRAGQFKGRICL